MITGLPFKDRLVAVLGLGRSGLSATRALLESGARVWAWDDNAERRAALATMGLAPVDLAAQDWSKPSTLVLSPGIAHGFPTPHRVAELARANRVEIIGDIELLARARRESTYIGITGTNGKSTTTALIGHVLRAAGQRIEVGGNIGVPVLDLAPLGRHGAYVLEMSSYQLELTPSLTFDVAVLLNITPDHLDRHGGMEGYVAAKRRIFDRQRSPRTAVIGMDDPISRDLHDTLARAARQHVVPVAVGRTIERGVYVLDGVLFDAIDGPVRRAVDLNPLATLPGAHNWQNAAAAYAACRAARARPEAIAAAMATFPGLAHRQELVGAIGAVRFINDSKATNADAAAKALACYRDIYWIAGGKAKEGGITALAPYFPRVRRAYLIGEAAEAFAATLRGKVDIVMSGDLAQALAAAHADAASEGGADPVVLLSPACASFDQFRDFEERGDVFRSLVTALAQPPRKRGNGAR
jgi:UDP-N-acetylmuramoylalanine--D-glutamate ligase